MFGGKFSESGNFKNIDQFVMQFEKEYSDEDADFVSDLST